MPLVPGHIKELEPYKPGMSIAEIKRDYNPAKIIKLGSNENPTGTSPKAIEAIKASLSQLNRYPSPVNSELRLLLANRFDVDINNVITGHGSEGIMSVIIRTFMLDDEEALTAEATFIGFKVLAKSRGIKLKTVPLKNYRFDYFHQ